MDKVFGNKIDNQTRCVHYSSKQDIIAIKFKCCEKFYPCIHCHNESENHDVERWKKEELDSLAILCGACSTKLSINSYLSSKNRCPSCNSAFNPKCEEHHDLYFEIPKKQG